MKITIGTNEMGWWVSWYGKDGNVFGGGFKSAQEAVSFFNGVRKIFGLKG